MTTPSLKGLTVLNTRPVARQAGLSAAIKAAGGRAVELPLLSIAPLQDAAAKARIEGSIEDLAQFAVLVFVSVPAAEIGVDLIRRRWPRLPPGLIALGLGPATGEALRPLLQVPEPELEDLTIVIADGSGSEAVLDLPMMSPARLQGRRVAVFRGRGGRELLAQGLQQRGAQVEYVEVYERVAVAYRPGEVAAVMAREGVDAAVITSVEALGCYSAALGPDMAAASLIPLVLPSARVQDAARQAGFPHAVNAAGSDAPSLLRALSTLRARSTSP